MTPSLFAGSFPAWFSRLLYAFAMLTCLVAVGGCKNDPAVHTSDPQMKGIDALLAAQLPPGTSAAHVESFCKERGYEQRDSVAPHTLVVIVNHINPETVRPETARVTFHFDPATDKLTTYELEPAPAMPVR
jgi:hypothetical protein